MDLIALHGPQRVGKDTIADLLVAHHGFRKIGFADALKQMAIDLDPMLDRWDGVKTGPRIDRLSEVVEKFGWEKAKDAYPEARRTLQRLATEVVRKWVGPDFWIDIVAKQIDAEPGKWVIPDLRFANEDAWLAARGGVLWEVSRPGHYYKPGHASEEWSPDIEQPNLIMVANSTGTRELRVTVGYALEESRNLVRA